MQSYQGLTQAEAEQRLAENGKNQLREEKPKSVFRMFLEQIFNFTNAILAAAIVISIILGDYGEAAIMLVIVIANAIIGVVQEGKAQKALDALKKMSVLKATVIRDGETKEISSEDLVVGDIVILEAGKQVPADLKLLETARLMLDEYVVGHGIGTDGAQEVHVMNLSEALSVNLKAEGFLNRDITLWQWLREKDYTIVNYGRNYDLIKNGKRS